MRDLGNPSRSDEQAWAKLSAGFNHVPLISNKPVLKQSSNETIHLKASEFQRAAVCGLFFVFGLFFILFPLLEAPPKPGQVPFMWRWVPFSVIQVIAVLFGTVSLFASIYAVLCRNHLRIDRIRNVVSVRWGMIPFAKTVELPLSELRLVLFQLHGNELGQAALGLESKFYLARIRVAKARWRSDMLPLYERLSPFFADQVQDETSDRESLSQKNTEIPCAPIRTELERGRNRRLQQKGNSLFLYSTENTLLFLLVPILMAGLTFALDLMFGPFQAVLRWSIAIVLLLMAVALVFFRPRAVILRSDDWLQLSGCKSDGLSAPALHAKDIVAVQLCTATCKGEHIPYVHIDLADFPVYQVNLIAKAPDVCRVNLLNDTNLPRTQAAAAQIAQFLNVPVVEHQVRLGVPLNAM